jgi:hypothetical protein
MLTMSAEHRSIVKEKYPNVENRNITKILGEWWTSLGPDEKNVFNNLAAELKVSRVPEQGCQMVFIFIPKISIWVYFGGYCLFSFGIFSPFWYAWTKKNLATLSEGS